MTTLPSETTQTTPPESEAGLASSLIAILFVSGKAMSRSQLCKALHVEEDEIPKVISEAKTLLERQHLGMQLMEFGSTLQLTTEPSVSPIVTEFLKEELEGKLSRSALETLAIVAYRGPISKPDIDYVRGVNSSVMLRTLLIRGLVERSKASNDARTFVYDVAPDLLRHLGIRQREELPDYAEFREHGTVSKLLAQAEDARLQAAGGVIPATTSEAVTEQELPRDQTHMAS